MKVSELWAAFSVKTDEGSFARALASVRHLRFSLLTLGSAVVGGTMFKHLIGFNARVEDAKNSIAGMLALAKGSGTTVASQLQVASNLYDEIRKKASELPGTTEEYVQAMQKLTLPIMTAGGSLSDLKDLTISTVVAAKSGVGGATVKTAITDVLQGIEGRFSTTDFFLKAILEPMGFVGEQGRKRFKALTKKQRFETLSKGLKNPVITELADIQSKSFTGQMDKAKEGIDQFLGAIGKPLKEELTVWLTKVNKWLTDNKEKVDAFTKSLGEGLVSVFKALGDVIHFIVENSDEFKDALTVIAIIIGGVLLKATLAWAAAWMPIFLTVFALVRLFKFLRERVGTELAVVITLLAAAFGIALILKFNAIAAAIWRMAAAMVGFRTASVGASAAGAAVNAGALAAGGLGPAGAAAPGVASKAGIGSKIATVGKALPLVAIPIVLDELQGNILQQATKMFEMQAALTKQFGEYSLEGVYRDMAAMGTTGVGLGDAFGRGSGSVNPNLAQAAPVTYNAGAITLNVADKQEMIRALKEHQEQEMRHLQNSTGGNGVR